MAYRCHSQSMHVGNNLVTNRSRGRAVRRAPVDSSEFGALSFFTVEGGRSTRLAKAGSLWRSGFRTKSSGRRTSSGTKSSGQGALWEPAIVGESISRRPQKSCPESRQSAFSPVFALCRINVSVELGGGSEWSPRRGSHFFPRRR
jgi:hypothetical protein